MVSSRNRTLRRKQNPPRFQLQKYVWNTILMKPQTESHTDLSGAFAALTSGKIPDEQELFYIDGETGALIRDAFGW